MRNLGIDEAGRGPVMGPLVIAGVLCDDQEELRALGVRDSKKLSPQRRRGLAQEIRRMAECKVLLISAAELDRGMEGASLNLLEAAYFAEIIRDLAPDKVWVDCCDTSEKRFRNHILRELGYELPMRVEHGADERYPVVSAASIIAKVRRDAEMRRISEEFGKPVGSGYAHDPQTVAFLEGWLRSRGEIPPHTRSGWKTSKRLLAKAKLRRLTEWE
ncbi:MAG: ribonuclease HII [Thermoplasmata archaeon]